MMNFKEWFNESAIAMSPWEAMEIMQLQDLKGKVLDGKILRQKFFELSRKYHPDLNIGNKNSLEMMIKVNNANATLSKLVNNALPSSEEESTSNYYSKQQEPSNYYYRQEPTNANKQSFPEPDPKALFKWGMVVEALNEISVHLGKHGFMYTAMIPKTIIPVINPGKSHGNDFNIFTDFLADYIQSWSRKPHSDDPNRIEFFHKANEIGNAIDPNKLHESLRELLEDIEKNPEHYSRGGVNGPEMRNSLRQLNSLLKKYK